MSSSLAFHASWCAEQARALHVAWAGREGVGRVRHMAANLLWLHPKHPTRVVSITPVPTATNVADLGTKALAKSRMNAWKCLVKMVDGTDERVGEMEFRDVENQERIG